MTTKIPPLSEFIDLDKRRREAAQHGFEPMRERVTVAVYDTASGYQTLTVRISEDLAAKYGLVKGARMVCHVHPDQQHLLLKPAAADARGAALFRPKTSRSVVYQTTLRGGTLEAQHATEATLSRVDNALVITLNA